jgi:hypothetical protein
MSDEEYSALIFLSKKYITDAEELRRVDSYHRSIETKNGIVRYLLRVRWQELEAPLPPMASFPRVWPPELDLTIEKVAIPIARYDVEQALKQKASKPFNVMVTKDPAGIVGWTKIDDYF